MPSQPLGRPTASEKERDPARAMKGNKSQLPHMAAEKCNTITKHTGQHDSPRTAYTGGEMKGAVQTSDRRKGIQNLQHEAECEQETKQRHQEQETSLQDTADWTQALCPWSEGHWFESWDRQTGLLAEPAQWPPNLLSPLCVSVRFMEGKMGRVKRPMGMSKVSLHYYCVPACCGAPKHCRRIHVWNPAHLYPDSGSQNMTIRELHSLTPNMEDTKHIILLSAATTKLKNRSASTPYPYLPNITQRVSQLQRLASKQYFIKPLWFILTKKLFPGWLIIHVFLQQIHTQSRRGELYKIFSSNIQPIQMNQVICTCFQLNGRLRKYFKSY